VRADCLSRARPDPRRQVSVGWNKRAVIAIVGVAQRDVRWLWVRIADEQLASAPKCAREGNWDWTDRERGRQLHQYYGVIPYWGVRVRLWTPTRPAGPVRHRLYRCPLPFWHGQQLGLVFFIGGEARVVAHNSFLDGNTFRDSRDVDKNVLVGDVQAGLAIALGTAARVTLSYVWRSEEFETQQGADHFGSLGFSMRF
jgi:hypothetical protein